MKYEYCIGGILMEDYSVLQLCLSNIDLKNNKIQEENLEKGKAKEYVDNVLTKSLHSDNVRRYKIKRESTEVIALISKFINEALLEDKKCEAQGKMDIHSIANNISLKLLEAEQKSQEKIAKMHIEIKKGSLIQAVIEDNSNEKNYLYVLSKAEFIGILDEKDWEAHVGPPLEKGILRTCIISYNDAGEINEITIFDSNDNGTDYWVNGFLEVDPCTTNEENTLKSFNEIDKVLVNNIKKKSPADYTILRNSLIGYYNQNREFDYEDFKNKVFSNYEPQDAEACNISKVKEKLDKVTLEKRFDKQFDIAPKVIRNKKRKTYNINSDIELTIKDNVKNLTDIIKAEKEGEDNLFIKIKVDQKTYKDFDFKN